MAIEYTPNTGMLKPSDFVEGWGTALNQNADLLDGLAIIGNASCALTNDTTIPLIVHVRGGPIRWVEFHTVKSLDEQIILHLDPYKTVYVYAIWDKIEVDAGWPAVHSFIPIARVTTDATTAAVIEDQRCPYLLAGFTYLIPLDYATDAAAAAGGVKIGELYHTAGTVKIRRA